MQKVQVHGRRMEPIDLLDVARQPRCAGLLHAAVSALAARDGTGIAELILESLEALGMDGAPRHRPRAQAAAWAVFDRAVAGKAMVLDSTPVGMARDDAGGTAGPLLMAIGMLGGPVRDRLVEELGAACGAKRAELVRVAVSGWGGRRVGCCWKGASVRSQG